MSPEAKQLDLLPIRRTTTTITVAGADLDRTIERLGDLRAVILAINIKGATYTLNVMLPPEELLAEAMRTLPDASQMQPRRQRRRSR